MVRSLFSLKSIFKWHFCLSLKRQHSRFLPMSLFRNEQPRSAGAGGAGLPDALCPRLPHLAPWTDAAVLEAGAWWEAYLWVPPILLGGLLHRHRATVSARRKPVTGTRVGQAWQQYTDGHAVVLILMLSGYLTCMYHTGHTHIHTHIKDSYYYYFVVTV